MTADRWSELIGRIAQHAPEAVDDLVANLDCAAPRPGRSVFPGVEGALAPMTPMARHDAVAVGFRVTAPVPDLADRAMRLAAFALEQDVEMVILSHIDESGFERFGFRVERIAGDTAEARDACEEQIRRFWNIDLVL